MHQGWNIPDANAMQPDIPVYFVEVYTDDMSSRLLDNEPIGDSIQSTPHSRRIWLGNNVY